MIALALPGTSWAHRLPARVKLGLLVVAVVALMPVKTPAVLGGCLVALLVLYASLGRPALRAGARQVRPLVWLGAIILAYHTATGRTVEGAAIVLRILLLVGLANVVTLTTPLTAITAVAEELFAPLARLGLNPRVPAVSVALALRFLPVLQTRTVALAEAWRARSPRRVGPRIMVPLVLGTLDDAEHVAEALRARGGIGAEGERPERENSWKET